MDHMVMGRPSLLVLDIVQTCPHVMIPKVS